MEQKTRNIINKKTRLQLLNLCAVLYLLESLNTKQMSKMTRHESCGSRDSKEF